MGGDPLRLIKFPGDPEKAWTFLAQSLVFCAAEVLNALDDRASSSGEVVPEPTGNADVGLTSGDWKREGRVVDDGFVVSLLTSSVSSRLTRNSFDRRRYLRHFVARLRYRRRVATVLRRPIFPFFLR